jgi:hypothetical protein
MWKTIMLYKVFSCGHGGIDSRGYQIKNRLANRLKRYGLTEHEAVHYLPNKEQSSYATLWRDKFWGKMKEIVV